MFGDSLNFLEVLFLLVGVHYLADYSFQNDYVAQAKNHKSDLGKPDKIWINILFGHAMIHGLMVYLVTSSLFLGIIQVVTHMTIDYIKCEGEITHWQDQVLHLIIMFILAIGYVTHL